MRAPSTFVLVSCLVAGAAASAPARAQQPVTQTAASTPDTHDTRASAVMSDEYRIGPGDKLRVEVYKDDQLSQSLQVRPDGKITLPLIGDVSAVGLTPLELRDRLATALKEYVNTPTVTVIVTDIATNVYVMGEVVHPGGVTMTGPMTVVQALAMAGGFKDFANTKDIRILRRNGATTETIRFNYRDAVKSTGDQVYLKPGDTVIVP